MAFITRQILINFIFFSLMFFYWILPHKILIKICFKLPSTSAEECVLACGHGHT